MSQDSMHRILPNSIVSKMYSEYGRRNILCEHGKKRSAMHTVLCLNFFADAHYYYLGWV